MSLVSGPRPARRTSTAGYETRQCGPCEGSGVVMECGDGPQDRPRRSTCSRCEGRGKARVFVYGARVACGSPMKEAP